MLKPVPLQIVFTAAVAAALAVGAGGLLQYLFPVAAVITAAMIARRSLPAYLSFVIWLWMLTPLVRRVADLQSGWHEQSLIILAPYGASAWPAAREVMAAAVRSIRVWPRLEGLGLFIVAGIGAGVGIPIGVLTAPTSALVETLNWWVPIALGAYIAVRTTDLEATERGVARTLMQAAVVVGAYALYQFQYAPLWDMEWLRNTESATFGQAREFEVRVFSTAHSPGVLSFLILPPIILWMARPRLWTSVALAAASLALALSQVRAAWLALIVSAVLVECRVGARERMALLAFLLVVGVCSAPFLLPFEVSDVTSSRFLTILNLEGDESALSRYEGHEEMFDVIRQHPLGLGIGIEDPNLAQVIGPRDSIVVTSFVQFGLIGATIYLLAMMALLVRLCVAYRNAVTSEGLALSAVGLGLLSVGLFGTQTAGPIGVVLWMAAGLGTVRVRRWRLARREARAAVRGPAKVLELRPAVAPGGFD